MKLMGSLLININYIHTCTCALFTCPGPMVNLVDNQKTLHVNLIAKWLYGITEAPQQNQSMAMKPDSHRVGWTLFRMHRLFYYVNFQRVFA